MRFIYKGIVVPLEGVGMGLIDYNVLAGWGIVHKINKEVLHPLGLATCYEVDSGASFGCIVDREDFEFSFAPEETEVNERAFNSFMSNRRENLLNALGESSPKFADVPLNKGHFIINKKKVYFVKGTFKDAGGVPWLNCDSRRDMTSVHIPVEGSSIIGSVAKTFLLDIVETAVDKFYGKGLVIDSVIPRKGGSDGYYASVSLGDSWKYNLVCEFNEERTDVNALVEKVSMVGESITFTPMKRFGATLPFNAGAIDTMYAGNLLMDVILKEEGLQDE